MSSIQKNDDYFMAQALLCAAQGLGRTAPNPPVGAIIAKQGRLLANGFHAQAGGPHAELVALKKIGQAARGATLYVTLEPCAHQGKTPPCVDAIIAAGIKRVVVGFRDPHTLVNGRGLTRLKAQGIEVTLGVLAAECKAFYAPYTVFVREQRPYVTLKAACSLDGRVATASGESKWLTGPLARRDVHSVRDQVDAILVGAGTVRADNPRLTCRVPRRRPGKPLLRLVLDSHLSVPFNSKIFSGKAPTWIITALEASATAQQRFEDQGIRVVRCKRTADGIELKDLLAELARQGIMHLLVEGGGHVHSSFVRASLVDQLQLYYAPLMLGDTAQALLPALDYKTLSAAMRFQDVQWTQLGPDARCITKRKI